MQAISSYRGNRPIYTQTHPHTNRHDRWLQYTTPHLARCNKSKKKTEIREVLADCARLQIVLAYVQIRTAPYAITVDRQVCSDFAALAVILVFRFNSSSQSSDVKSRDSVLLRDSLETLCMSWSWSWSCKNDFKNRHCQPLSMKRCLNFALVWNVCELG